MVAATVYIFLCVVFEILKICDKRITKKNVYLCLPKYIKDTLLPS